jgi:hypothetical protein
MTRRCSRFSILFSCLAALGAASGCGMEAPPPATPSAHANVAPPPPLTRSLFSTGPTGSLSEDDMQKILDARIDLAFPARLGVVALSHPFDPEKRASVAERAIVAREVTRALDGSRDFSLVTDVSTDLPNPDGIEGLRTIAARYHTRYLLLCSAVTENDTHLNNWAWLYATGVGLLLAPGTTVASDGLVQASLFDVKTGTVLYTVVEPYRSSSVTWLVGSGREHASIDERALDEAARHLGRKVLTQTDVLARWVARQPKPDASAAAAPQPKPDVTAVDRHPSSPDPLAKSGAGPSQTKH